MANKAPLFFTELGHRLGSVPATSTTMDSILAICDDEESLLKLADPSAHSMPMAILDRFTMEWPEDQALGSPAGIALVKAARECDERLKKLVDRLVPKKVGERAFWRNYFSHVHAILAAAAPSDEDKVCIHMAQMPPPRSPDKKRFPAKADLRSSGSLSREEIVSFVEECAKMACSRESLDRYARGAVDHNEDISEAMLQDQLELLESKGIERAFGIWSMSPPIAQRRFPDDEELMQALNLFQARCRQASALAMQQAQQRASPPESGKRIFSPASSLKSDGDMSLAELTEVVQRIDKELTADKSREMLTVAVKAGQDAGNVLIRWERELLEQEGLQQDYGIGQLRAIPSRVNQDRSAAGEVPEEGLRALEGIQTLAEHIETMSREIEIEVTKPQPQELEKRRFKPADMDGGPPLQRSGLLTREQLMRFCTGIKDILVSDESISLLAERSMQDAGLLSVTWQREYLEHLGIEQVMAEGSTGGGRRDARSCSPVLALRPPGTQDFGCNALVPSAQRFVNQNDQEVQKAFIAFQTACHLSIKKAMLVRKERETLKETASET